MHFSKSIAYYLERNLVIMNGVYQGKCFVVDAADLEDQTFKRCALLYKRLFSNYGLGEGRILQNNKPQTFMMCVLLCKGELSNYELGAEFF